MLSTVDEIKLSRYSSTNDEYDNDDGMRACVLADRMRNNVYGDLLLFFADGKRC